MPLFEYECEECRNSVEILVMNSREEVACPICQSKKLRKQLSVIATPSIAGGRGSSVCELPSTGCGKPQCGTGGCMFGG